MAETEVSKAPTHPPKINAQPSRDYASSLRAILLSRHPNTKRNAARRPKGRPIRDMIVVKLYDQMDSLRDILGQPAQCHEDVEGMEDMEEATDQEDSEGADQLDATRARSEERDVTQSRTNKRTYEEIDLDSEDGVGEAKESKRHETTMKIIDLCCTPSTPRVEATFATEKENLPPHIEVSLFYAIYSDCRISVRMT
jgi:hypothetical protein